MPRNSSGTMSAPAGQPAVSGTTISSTTFNTLVGDLIGELSDSLSRSGKGSMLAPVRVPDGGVAAPSYSFVSEPASGLYRAGANDVRLAVGGVDALKLVSGGVGPINLAATPTQIQVTVANGWMLLQGNLVAADASGNADVSATSTVTRTAGWIFRVINNGVNKLMVDYQGLLTLAAPAAAIQPASLVTAITPNAGLTAVGFAYWKDACGMVHLEGSVTNASGSSISNIATTSPLPVGFRANATMVAAASGGFFSVSVSATTGAITTSTPGLPAGGQMFFDGLSFRATA